MMDALVEIGIIWGTVYIAQLPDKKDRIKGLLLLAGMKTVKELL